MRKRVFNEVTIPFNILEFVRKLEPQEPKVFESNLDLTKMMRQINEYHLILGLFPYGKDDIYYNQLIEVSNKYSHLPFYACFEIENVAKTLNLTVTNTTILIYRKPELKPPGLDDYIIWDQDDTLMNFIEENYHMPVDIYNHDSKSLYDLHTDDVGIIYFSGANTLYHQGRGSPVSLILMALDRINNRLKNSSSEFITEESKYRFDHFTLALSFKEEFWIWAQKLHLKMKMDFSEEFSPIVKDTKKRFYMDSDLANMTLDTLDEDRIYQFYYNYIQGDIQEYNKTESIHESYIMGDKWGRRLEETDTSAALAVKFNSVEIKKLVAQNFRYEVEEKGVEALIIMTIDDCDFCETFVSKHIMKDFASTTKFSPNFKIFVIEASKNSLPEEYHMARLPHVMFSSKEVESYNPVTWWTKDYELKDLKKFLHEHSEEFPKIDKSKR
mmetsp:Transcript_18893/g.21150  ORF Transcript_18893/g.21150 Transcript_18893/m.21150 type:complete len:441 (+) Transcript_18893:365-1687(+)|eukprot:CAMPEP_0205819868 /NCGR_PEP_ID=MMETSP0206-20130828/2365_1 /ASSEMBLY_ACC=CAM_ASM_000279 /TAXON_ID=36767 /ORGANISM="Euplotes focardii, Strain TN1" /LENGTH=440 /DNA_ID=CAMNT_0053113927 /DNA_START=303 /DNA_END=1625 /DNA_ORIENTATION=+